MAESDTARLMRILQENAQKNFVQRILYKDKYPTLPLKEMGEDKHGTHLMSYSTTDKGAFAYPQIIQDPQTGELVRLPPDVAARHAYGTGQYIEFKTPDEADWFTKNYKKVWDK